MVEPSFSPSQTILCVDDLQESLTIRKMMLELLGYRVLTSTSPIEGIKVLESDTVDLVVTDYRFSGEAEDGEWLAHKVRERWSGVKTIMLSGYPEIPESAMESVDYFCVKGAEPGELKQAISKLLDLEDKTLTLEKNQKRNAELRARALRLRNDARRRRRLG